jgi:nitrogen PTS system EIIA component
MDLKIKDVAELLSVSETTIRRWLSEGKIPAYKIHHQYRFSRIEIENWMMSCRVNKSGNSFLPTAEEQIYPPKDEEEKSGNQQFSLFRAVHHGDVFTDIESTGKEQIIHQVVDRIAGKLGLDDDVLSELLIDRERMMPTALNNGIAIPHTRDFLLKGPTDVVIPVFLKDPIDWGALDGQKVHTLFFLFASNDKRHLHLLAKIAHISSIEEALNLFQTRPEKGPLLDYLRGWEASS